MRPASVAVGLLVCAPLLAAKDLGPLPVEFQPCAESATVVGQEMDEDNSTAPQLSWDVDDVRPCLDSIKTDLHTMILTLENLFFGVTTMYAFTTIVTDSAASVQRNKCGLDVHDVKVDLYQELALIWRELVEPASREAGLEHAASMTAEEILIALDRPTSVPALSFHSRLNALFSRLLDAHTRYSVRWDGVPVLQILPLEFELVPKALGEPHAPRVLARLVTNDHPAGAFREVVTINDVDPHEFLEEVADRRGGYLDEGQLVNALLLGGDALGDPQGRHGLQLRVAQECDVVAPNRSTVRVDFADGSGLETKWRVQLEPNATVGTLRKASAAFERLQQMEVEKLLLRERQIERCLYIPGCDPDLAHELVPRPEEPQAIRAYRRLFGDWLPEEALARVAELGASKAKDGTGRADREPKPALSALASEAIGDAAPGGNELLAEIVAASDPAPGLRGANRVPTDASIAVAAGEVDVNSQAAEQEPLSERARNDSVRIQECLTNHSNASDVEVLFAPLEGSMVVMGLGDMVVIKMTSFGSLPDAMEGYKIAVDHARQRGIKRLLFDLVGNGGGSIALDVLFQSLILKIYDPAELCAGYNQKVNAYWREWILSFGTGIETAVRGVVERIAPRVERIPLRVGKWLARWHLKHLRVILRAFDEILEPLRADGLCQASFNTTTRIDRWIWRVGRARSRGDLLGFMERVMLRQEFLPNCITVRLPSNNSDTPDSFGWFPFTGIFVWNRTDVLPFPDLAGLLEPVRQRWGDGRASGQEYSQRGVFAACPFNVASMANLEQLSMLGNPDLREYRDHPFTDVAILTDGLAGSSGSVFPSRLMASGFVTMFTYGGSGEAMDSSAFSGGNVVRYDGWWQQAAVAAELGMWLVPGSPWESLSRNLSLTSDLSGSESVIYPRPMPLEAASASFTFNMVYITQFDVEGDRTQLPRQFYRLPAHKHYSVWPRGLRKTCGNPSGLLEMYARIQQENWWQVRSNPQYLGAGWSSECVPDEAHMRCCEVREAPGEL